VLYATTFHYLVVRPTQSPHLPYTSLFRSLSLNRRAPNCKQKDLIGIPWLLAFALRADGWYLRSDIIWQKENPMPESCKDRPSHRSEEHTSELQSRFDIVSSLLLEKKNIKY